MSLELIHKNSSVSQKEPLPDMLAFGELGLNFSADGPFLTCKDSEGRIRRLPGLQNGPQPPSVAYPGDIWVDTGDPGGVWVYGPDGWFQVSNPLPPHTPPCYIGDSPPIDPPPMSGDLWWNTEDGTLYVYYVDVDSEQWAPATPQGGQADQDEGLYT
jgi:hypothetical protein